MPKPYSFRVLGIMIGYGLLGNCWDGGEWELGGYGDLWGMEGESRGLRDCSGYSLNFPRRVAHAYVTKKESGFRASTESASFLCHIVTWLSRLF